MWAKFKKLSNPTSTKAVLEIVRADETISNDKKEVLKRWHTDIYNLFSGLRNNPDFPFNDNFYQEILDKKAEFEAMAPNDQEQVSNFDSVSLNNDILFDEVSKANPK